MTGRIDDPETGKSKPAGLARTTADPLGLARHPAGLGVLFMTELWERFSYYGMRALLVLYMTAPALAGGPGFSAAEAGRIYGNYTMAVYLLAIPGGFLVDTLIGPRRAVLWGGLVIACGHFSLAVPGMATFYLGLVLIALGTGLFKPSISALVGALYARDDDRRDAGFSIFYMGINIGAFLAPLVTGFLAQSDWFKDVLAARGLDPAHSWHWGFAAAGVGMVLSLLFYAPRSRNLPEGRGDPMDEGAWRNAMAFVAALTIVLLGLVVLSDLPGFTWLRIVFVAVPAVAIAIFARAEDLERRRLAGVFVFFLAAMLFWAVFEQAGTSITLFADQLTDNTVLGYAFPSAWYQALNPLFVIAFAPVLAGIWLRMGDRQPAAAIKFTIGLALLGVSLVFMIPAAMLAASGKVSPLWLVGLFLLQTLGELCVSPVGLSAMTRLASPGRTAIMLGIWFLAASWGSKLAGIMGARFSPEATADLGSFFLEQALVVGLAALVPWRVAPWLNGLMRDKDEVEKA